MPRREGIVAAKASITEGWTRIRFLLRTPKFREDLLKVQSFYEDIFEPKKDQEKGTKQGLAKGKAHTNEIRSYWEFLKKWDLSWLPFKWMMPKEDSDGFPSTIKEEEQFLLREMLSRKDDPDLGKGLIFKPAVVAWDPDEVKFNNWVEANLDVGGGLNFPPGLKMGKTLMLKLELGYPQDVLEETVKLEIKKAMKKRHRLEAKGQFPMTPIRRRLDKVDYQLAVYDRANQGETFAKIHRSLKKPVSTVKSLLLAATQNIYGSLSGPSKKKLPPKKKLPLMDLDPDKHIATCPQCSKAKTVEEMCSKVQIFAEQDQVSQRELPGVDTIRDLNVDYTGKVQGTGQVPSLPPAE